MIYREYGQTGKKISAISFGGMRFEDPEDIDTSAETVVAAARAGINYLDTAPGYCANKSEAIMGAAIKTLRAEGREFYVSTKCGAPEYDRFMQSLENSLKVMGVDHIDFMHSWGVNSPATFSARKEKGAIRAMAEAKEQGLISHVVCSSHMDGENIAELMDQGVFEGVTLGFCAINFPFRMEGIQGAYRNNLGVVTMNPLGGGEIIRHEDRFSFIKTREDQSILEAAIHFNLSHKEITSALIGFRNVDDVESAVATLESFEPIEDAEMERIKEQIEGEFDELCTTCNYCRNCPQGIPVSSFIEAYNHFILNDDPQAVFNRLKWHWGIHSTELLDNCTQCGLCERECTQKLPILERFDHIRELEQQLQQGQ